MKNNHDDRNEGDGSPSSDDLPPYEANVYAAIVELIQNGEKDQVLWAAAYAACHARAACSIRARWPRLGDQADDVFQIACWSATRALRNGVDVPNPAAWFFKIVINAAAKYSGTDADYRGHIHLGTDMNPEAGSNFEPEARPAVHVYEDERQKLHEAIDELPGRQRAAVADKFLKSHPYEQIAITLGCSADAARILVCRGLTALREMMKGDCND